MKSREGTLFMPMTWFKKWSHCQETSLELGKLEGCTEEKPIILLAL
jgi:hypothetical protein